MTAYYNEHDPYAAQWLRNLIAAGHIAPGHVDESDIRDINPDTLAKYTQCHFFAGIGVWSHALRRAGWPDDRPIWTGSCPCQPFSSAGAGAGFADERHLWPHFHWLIDQCRPPICIGEQIASKDGLGWLDLVQADLEGSGYAFGASDLCAAGFGGAHIRQRLYWVGVADADDARFSRCGELGKFTFQEGRQGAEGHGSSHRLVDVEQGQPCAPMLGRNPADWLFCRDGKWRPVGPGTFPMDHEATARVGRLRAYGNALDAETATGFCEAVKELAGD